MHVSDIMTKPVFIQSDKSVSEACRTMVSAGSEALLVMDDNTLRGILTEKDILLKIVAKSRDPKAYSVSDIMSSPVVSVKHNAHIYDASDIMDQHKIRKLAVDKNGAIVGVISATDITRNYKYVVSRYLTKGYSRPSFLEKAIR